MQLMRRAAMLREQYPQLAAFDGSVADVEGQQCHAGTADGSLHRQMHVVRHHGCDVVDLGDFSLRTVQSPALGLARHAAGTQAALSLQSLHAVEGPVLPNVRRAGSQYLLAGAEGTHHQVGIFQRTPDPHGHIETLADDIDPAIAQFQLQPHIRMGAQEARQQRRQEDVRHPHGRTHP